MGGARWRFVFQIYLPAIDTQVIGKAALLHIFTCAGAAFSRKNIQLGDVDGYVFPQDKIRESNIGG